MSHHFLRSFLRSPALCASLALAAALVAGCVTDPSNGDSIQMGAPTYFAGFAGNPGASVEVQVLNRSMDQWEVLSTAVSDTTATVYGGRSIYHWSTSAAVLLPNVPSTFCRLTSNCLPKIDVAASVRVVEAGSSIPQMVTFEDDGLECTIDGVNDGEDLFGAAWNCRSPGSPELRLVHK